MLNELWQKAVEMSKMLKTIPEDQYIVSLRIYINLINNYIDKLKADIRKHHREQRMKELKDAQDRRVRHIRFRRFIQGL